MKRITIEPVSRIEGHAKITIHLDDKGHVAGTEFHVTQVRGLSDQPPAGLVEGLRRHHGGANPSRS